MTERIITVEKADNKIIYTGSTERTTAEQYGIRHLTVIAAPIITEGKDKGKLLVHNRRDKQLAKGKACPKYSYNFFGGHCNPPAVESPLIGKPVNEELLLENILRELSEEMYLPTEADAKTTVLENKADGSAIYAKPFPLNRSDLIPLGYTVYSSCNDNEFSFVYALPLTSDTAGRVIAADDFQKPDGSKGNLALPTALMTLDDLRALYEKGDNDTEICNAISRLWEKQNEAVYRKLTKLIDQTA